jgi:hypothetical protein
MSGTTTECDDVKARDVDVSAHDTTPELSSHRCVSKFGGVETVVEL